MGSLWYEFFYGLVVVCFVVSAEAQTPQTAKPGPEQGTGTLKIHRY
jgi:hypothetical protein